MRLIYVLLLIGLSACDKPIREKASEPHFFFYWDAENETGACLNKQGVAGYNPKYIGPCGDLRGYSFKFSNLDGADLRGAILDGMNLSGFSLNGVNLKAALARGTNFSAAKMNGVKLMHGHFEGANFEETELNGADLEQAQLSGATLSDSTLMGANFRLANLSGSKLPHRLHTTNFSNATFSYGTELPFSDKAALARGMRATHITQKSVAKYSAEEKSAPPTDRVPASPETVHLEKTKKPDK